MLGRGQPGQDRSGLRWIGAESGGLGWFRLDPHPILHQSNSIHPDPRVPEDSCASSGSSFTQSVGQHPQGHHSRSPFSATVRGFVRRRKEAGGRAPFPCGENDKKRERQDCISRWTPSPSNTFWANARAPCPTWCASAGACDEFVRGFIPVLWRLACSWVRIGFVL